LWPVWYHRRVPIDLICIDADDTLWRHVRHFEVAQRTVVDVLAPYVAGHVTRERLEAVEARNLAIYGYGVKSFTLSMIETALDLCGDALPASAVGEILAAGRDLMRHPIELLPGVEDALDALAERGRLVLVTKGDLFHQEAKLAASGLGERFTGVEIVSDKTVHAFRRLFERYEVEPMQSAMAGDSVRSDILPALAAGAWAAHVPPDDVWAHEHAEAPEDHPRFRRFARLGDLPAWIDSIP
jgi:putative hydrolase of the HAD superfamily